MSFPYITVVGSLKDFINKIPSMGVPEKINTKTLPSMGFKSTNDRVLATTIYKIH